MPPWPADPDPAATVVTFGEPLVAALPLEPRPLEHSPTLQLHVGGAEVNFAVGSGGSACPPVSAGTSATIRLAGSCGKRFRPRALTWPISGCGPEPTGLYLREWLPDGERRPYYRTSSAGGSFGPADWPQHLTGVGWLHLTGITPALSESCREDWGSLPGHLRLGERQ